MSWNSCDHCWVGMVRGTLFALVGLAVPACAPKSPPSPSTPPVESRPKLAIPLPQHEPARVDTIRFRDVTSRTGITFRHVSGMHPDRDFPTNFGCGVALIDYDRDGWLDIYFCNTKPLTGDPPAQPPGNRLYRNRGDLTFEDVTDRAGVGYRGFNHGVAVGDVDNNGFPDLFLTNYGPNVLYLNNGDGTFRDASAGSGLTDVPWSTGAAFLDYDGDGRLDVYVSCYGEWTVEGEHPFCGDEKRNVRVYCSPYSITPVRHHLYKNGGNARFEETTESAGVARNDGRGLGVVAADVNRDGRPDLYVANDGCPNFLFLNRGDGTFEDVSEPSGAAVNEAGEVQGSMGVDAEDLDGDGWPELFVTNFRGQYNALYKNHRGANFQDVSAVAGVIAGSGRWVGWGCALSDFDNDGFPDMFVVNGEVDDNLKEFGQDSPFAEPSAVWRNKGDGRFQLLRDPGPFFAATHVARGAAFGDLDNDGRLDVVVGIFDGPPAVLINESEPRSWIRLELVAGPTNRSAVGASVAVHAGGRVFHRLVKGGGSYLSANDPRVLVGLGAIEGVDRVEVRWPGGGRTVLEHPELGRTHQVRDPLEKAAR